VTKHIWGLAAGRALAPLSLSLLAQGLASRDSRNRYSEFGSAGSLEGARANSVSLPPMRSGSRLYLNIFRREQLSLRLIRLSLLPTGSSHRFINPDEFGPPRSLPALHPAHGSSRSFGSTTSDKLRPFQTRFPLCSSRKTLTKPLTVTRRIIMQKDAVTHSR